MEIAKVKLSFVLLSLASTYVRKVVYTAQHNQDLYNRSKQCISISHPQAQYAAPWRVTDIMATNGCLVSSYSIMIKNMLGKDISIPVFESCYEAIEI